MSVYIHEEFLRGAKAAAKWAHDNYGDTEAVDILDATVAAEVLSKWKEDEA